MYQLNEFDRGVALSAIDKQQIQKRPLLAESVFRKASTHQIMVFNTVTLNAEAGRLICREGCQITVSVVKGKIDWAAYFMFGSYSPEYVAEHGKKLTSAQIASIMDCEGDLIQLYRD